MVAVVGRGEAGGDHAGLRRFEVVDVDADVIVGPALREGRRRAERGVLLLERDVVLVRTGVSA